MITDTIFLKLLKYNASIAPILLTLILFFLAYYNWSIIYTSLKGNSVISSVVFGLISFLLSKNILITFSFFTKIFGLKKSGYCIIRQLTIEQYIKSDIKVESTDPSYDLIKLYGLQRSIIKIKNKSYQFYYDNTWIKIKDKETIALRRVKQSNIIFYIGEE